MHAPTAPAWSSHREIPPARVETSAGAVDVHVRGGVVAGGAPPGAQFVIYRMRPAEVVVHRPDGRRERAPVPDTAVRTLRRMLVAGAAVALLSVMVERTLRT